MKKIYLAVFLACSMGGAVHAQISEGGLPWSVGNNTANSLSVKPVTLATPDFETAKKQYEKDVMDGKPRAYLGGLMVNTDISLTKAGQFTYLKDGRKIWRAKIEINNVQAVNLYYNDFQLPAGVTYYISNGNGKQLLGAFTRSNNSPDGLFATGAIQGGTVNLELNIDADVKLEDIRFHIDRVGAMFRGEEYVADIYSSDETKDNVVLKPTLDGDQAIGSSSPCHINAFCPVVPAAQNAARSATARIVIPGAGFIGFCSGTLLNSTGGVCKPYFLTAAHCDGENVNGTTDDHFAQWMFDFNMQYPGCTNTGDPLANRKRITGAFFRSRSRYPSSGTAGAKDAIQDFLFLELRQTPAAEWGVSLAGWNRSSTVYMTDVDTFWGFHHPGGDVKKMSLTTQITPNGTFNQNSVAGTHWAMNFDYGVTQGGSSGSGLFDKNGLLIGDLSGGDFATGTCAPAGTDGLYSKFFRAWDFAEPGQSSSPATRLKDWLDPTNSNAITVAAASLPCDGVGIKEAELKNAFSIFPNPSTGLVKMKTNFAQPTALTVNVVGITGATLATYKIEKSISGEYLMDMTQLANGIYLIKVSSDEAQVTQKFVLAR
ncbi:T9SS type A sorting domain-containing protein [Taibaiella helva]|uniref:T9SS type A sorting domain-containing protein n=1 Tax=Taibaiella helva TaxID=2301235 RepID=UPI000E56AF33|nr:T9SS type A sorting domain-containing protein [Taibaiella helva]